ncbi:MAG: hypothetical protein ACXWQO_13365 [Bdellovibrionota bacterium]
MKNKAWFFLLILLCGSVATLSAFARSPDGENFSSNEEEISNDQATRDKMDAVEAAETCKVDCTKEETRTCDAKVDMLIKADYHKCLKGVSALCDSKCD